MAWIIVEGPTCSGKTTLYNEIDRRFGESGGEINRIHMGRPDELTRGWVLERYVTGWEASDADHVLADRWHWGEATYAPLYRPETNTDGFGLLGKAGWRWTEMFLASRGACVALLSADNDTLAERLKDRGDDHVQNLDELFQVSSLYNHARRESNTVAGVFDTSGEVDADAYATFIQTVLDEAQTRSERAADLNSRFPRYIGSQSPGVLLVGDERNIGRRGELTQLPFMPIDGNSGEYLLNALPDMFWRTCGIINGNEDTDLAALVEALDNPRIVALGNNAQQALADAKIVAPKVPHPQHTRRFQHDRQKEYGQAMVAAANGEESPWIR